MFVGCEHGQHQRTKMFPILDYRVVANQGQSPLKPQGNPLGNQVERNLIGIHQEYPMAMIQQQYADWDSS